MQHVFSCTHVFCGSPFVVWKFSSSSLMTPQSNRQVPMVTLQPSSVGMVTARSLPESGEHRQTTAGGFGSAQLQRHRSVAGLSRQHETCLLSCMQIETFFHYCFRLGFQTDQQTGALGVK